MVTCNLVLNVPINILAALLYNANSLFRFVFIY